MKRHTPGKPGKSPKAPFRCGGGGKEFDPSSFGEKRATGKSWASKVPLPNKK